MALLSLQEQQAIELALQQKLDSIGKEDSVSASWVPGSDWTGTPYFPIYTTACHGNFSEAAKLFGQVFKKAIIDHSGEWACVKQETSRPKHGLKQVKVLLYWRRA